MNNEDQRIHWSYDIDCNSQNLGEETNIVNGRMDKWCGISICWNITLQRRWIIYHSRQQYSDLINTRLGENKKVKQEAQWLHLFCTWNYAKLIHGVRNEDGGYLGEEGDDDNERHKEQRARARIESHVRSDGPPFGMLDSPSSFLSGARLTGAKWHLV